MTTNRVERNKYIVINHKTNVKHIEKISQWCNWSFWGKKDREYRENWLRIFNIDKQLQLTDLWGLDSPM